LCDGYARGPIGQLRLRRSWWRRRLCVPRGFGAWPLNDDPTNEGSSRIVHELMEVARASKARRFLLAADPLSRVAIGLTVTVVVCFSLLTAINGPPSRPPDTPAASLQRDADLARLELYTKSLPQVRSTVGPMSTPRQLPDVDTMIERLAARLQSQPDDAEGWRMLGWSYYHVQRPPRPPKAYARAVVWRPESSEFQSANGEVLVGAQGGTVTPEALGAFTGALAMDAQNPKARYFVVLSKLQAGNTRRSRTCSGCRQRPLTMNHG